MLLSLTASRPALVAIGLNYHGFNGSTGVNGNSGNSFPVAPWSSGAISSTWLFDSTYAAA
jgi:hypothetical protein